MNTIKIWLSAELRVEDTTTTTLAQYSTAELVVLFAATPATGPTFNWITPGGVKIEQRALFRDGELDEGGYFAYKATIYPFFSVGISSNMDIGYSRVSVYVDAMFSSMVKIPINKTILPDQLDLPISNYEDLLNKLTDLDAALDAKANLTGGNSFTGNQIVDGTINAYGGQFYNMLITSQLHKNNTKIVDLAAGTASTDAANVGNVNSAISIHNTDENAHTNLLNRLAALELRIAALEE